MGGGRTSVGTRKKPLDYKLDNDSDWQDGALPAKRTVVHTARFVCTSSLVLITQDIVLYLVYYVQTTVCTTTAVLMSYSRLRVSKERCATNSCSLLAHIDNRQPSK